MQPERKVRMITSCYDEALDRIKWMETGLEQLIKRYPNDKELGGRIRTFVRALLDGEPTTADEHNTMQEDEKLVYEDEHSCMIQYDENKDTCKHGRTRASYCADCDAAAGVSDIIRISDVNKEIAVDWKNREREEKIKKKTNMIQSIGYRGED